MKTPEQQKEDLKNCPCCESSEVSAFVNDGYFSIACRACGVLVARNVEIAFAGGEAVKAWNTRPTSAADLVEKAKAEWERLKAIEHQPCSGIYYTVQAMEYVIKFLEAEVGK